MAGVPRPSVHTASSCLSNPLKTVAGTRKRSFSLYCLAISSNPKSGLRVSAARRSKSSRSAPDGGVAAGHRSPDVPRKHFHVVQRREVSQQVLGDLHKASHIENAEGLRIGFALAAARPSLACHQKLVARNVKQIERGLEHVLLDGVDLRIDENPLLAPAVPIFADPMVLVSAREKIGRRSRSGREPERPWRATWIRAEP